MNKNCEICSVLMEDVHKNTKYCDVCNKKLKRDRIEACRLKKKAKDDIVKDIKYQENFMEVTTELYTLTSKGFNIVSGIKNKSYCQFYECKWVDIVKKYNKFDELFKYTVNEYQKFYNETGSQDLHKFANNHTYFTYELIMDIGIDNIMQECGIRKLSYTNDDFEHNFFMTKEKLGRIPLYMEFEDFSKIKIASYSFRFNLKGKNIYDRIVKMYVADEEFNQYLQDKKTHKTKVGKLTGALSVVYSLEELEIEFKRVFDYCLKEFGVNPPRRYFNKISKFDDRTYRKRLQKSWLDICQYYGYKVDKTANNSEKIVLDSISKILNVGYESQKTWKWLIGAGGKNMFCDGYFSELNLVIEFDGSQHRRPIEKYGGNDKLQRTIENDSLKNQYLKEHNILLIRIDSREPWQEMKYLAQKLKEHGIPVKDEYVTTSYSA